MIHIYTGAGKGKTTAAFGLAIRAAGAGKRVFIGQFLKGRKYSELNSLKKLKNITIAQFGGRCFVGKTPKPQDVTLAEKGLLKIKQCITCRKFDVVILDEINIAVYLKLLKLKELLSVVKNCPQRIELILTGRSAHPKIIKLADYVTEMREVKHPFRNKVSARKGIEF